MELKRGFFVSLSLPFYRVPALLVFLLGATPLFAQPEGVALKHLTTDDGLSHNFVTCIARDTQGFIWFGTVDGLTRYDGKRCMVFRHTYGDTGSLPASRVTGLSLDPNGRLWVMTEKGMCYWDYSKRHFQRLHPMRPGTAPPHIHTSLAFDKDGFAWGIEDSFLIRMDLQSFERMEVRLPTDDLGESMIFIDSKNRIWANIWGKLYLYAPETGRFDFKQGRKHPDPSKRTIAGTVREDEQGRIWSSSWGKGFLVYNDATGAFDDYPDGPGITTSFIFDRHPIAGPIIWSGGGFYGLYWQTLIDSAIIQFPPRPREPFSHNNTMVRSIFKDPETQIIWIGTEAGVEKYDPNDLKFTRVMLPDSISPGQFSSLAGIVQDPYSPHHYWLAVWAKGFFEWDRQKNTMQSYGLEKGLYNHEVFDIIVDRQKHIWLAELECVQEFDPVTRRFRTHKPDFPTPGINHKILCLKEGSDGSIWIGSNYEGLYRLDPKTDRISRIKFMDKPQYVRCITEDKHGRLLIGDLDGYFRYNPANGNLEHFLTRDSIYHTCNGIVFDRDQRLWLATTEGLLRVDDQGKVKFALTTRNGLQNNYLNGIEIDKEDRFWLASANGLHRYYPKTGVVEVYRRADGLFDNDIAMGFRMLKRGELFIGFQDAFNMINPSRMPMNPYPPRVVLTDVHILNRPADWRPGAPIVLQPGDNVVSFAFSAINFTQPEKTVLLYKLEGFDPDWIETKQDIITYTNLDGGRYTLLVKARNGDGIWSPEPVRVTLRVIPPFHRTIWFRLLVLALAGGIIGLIVWYRQEQRRHLEVIRRRIARDLHDDMGSTLSSIRFFSEVAQAQLGDGPGGVKTLLQRIGQSAGALSESMQDIVWAINYRHDNLEDLAARMREFGLKISEARGIQFNADLPETFQQRALRPDQRRNIYLIFKEAVNNAAKYSKCTGINVSMQLHRNRLSMEISDNGNGFDPETVQYGNGLNNMQQRAKEIRGKLIIQTEPRQGVRILLDVDV
ncbi:MAG: two-component regulator propeller domain-containing protein [Saprospiraceae bacterium]